MSHSMKIKTSVTLVVVVSMAQTSVNAQGQLAGDEKLACEALLCLAASTRPTECVPSIRRYFSISYKRFSDTLRGRLNFLNLCPIVTQPHMTGYKSAIVNGAGRCDAASLNQSSFVSAAEGDSYISNVMPNYCQAYYGNGIQQLPAPIYVGEPMQGGYWVEALDYPQAAASYNEMRAKAATTASQPSGSTD